MGRWDGMKEEDVPGYATRFKPGVSGNPMGRAIASPEVLRMQRMTREELSSCASWLIKGNLKELGKISTDPKSSILHVMIARMAMKAISKGDEKTFNAIMDRVVGKPKEMLEVSGVEKTTVVILPSNGRETKEG